MIGLGAVYILAGLMFAGYALLTLRDANHSRPLRTAAFWGLLAASFLTGGRLGDLGNGMLVLALTALAAAGLGRGREASSTPVQRQAAAVRWGDRLFWMALIIPVVALIGALELKQIHLGALPLVDPKQASIIALALGVIAALAVAVPVLRAPLIAPLQEGVRLSDLVGWAAILPQMLAALGAVFALAGVGHAVGDLFARWLPGDSRLAAVVAYTLGMAVFTIVMGNAFAAFPVMTAGIGMPLIVQRFGGDPAIMGAIGMLSGFCGTLLTPMAANYNIVPVALLELSDRWAVIKVQAPTALIMLLVNTVLMYALVFRHWPS
ncbi:MAG: DUF979 domain-containing protein [Caulobacteraceae bacterium]